MLTRQEQFSHAVISPAWINLVCVGKGSKGPISTGTYLTLKCMFNIPHQITILGEIGNFAFLG